MLRYSIDDLRDLMFTASCRGVQPTSSLCNTAINEEQKNIKIAPEQLRRSRVTVTAMTVII